MVLIDIVFPKLQIVKDFVRPLSKKRRFRTHFDSQHVKGSQTFLKSAWDYFYPILRNEKFFLDFLFHLWNLHTILNILTKNMIFIANLFPKLLTVKDLVRPLSKKRRFRTFFDSQHVKGSQTLVKSAWERFYQIFVSLWVEIIWKISPLLIYEILGVFVNTMTADNKYLLWDYEDLSLQTQMQLSKNQKTFLQFFVPLMESTSNIKHFQRKDDRHS